MCIAITINYGFYFETEVCALHTFNSSILLICNLKVEIFRLIKINKHFHDSVINVPPSRDRFYTTEDP